MSGHSKWATIKHKKGKTDARRGKLFSKLSRAITVAAREGGADPNMNVSLANAVEKARSESMPKDNIEKAIQRSDLGLTPSNDGQLIRIVIPQLTEERRHELTKLCARRAEEARVAVRNIRRDEVDHLRKVEKDGHLSRDELERSLEQVQHITDQFISKVDDVVKKKEAEILEV